jgi:hypothetical protein
VHDESPDSHGLHCPSGNPDSGVIDTGRGANRITRSCGLSFVVAFAIGYSRRMGYMRSRTAGARHSWRFLSALGSYIPEIKT